MFDVHTHPVTNISHGNATLNGELDPDGIDTEYHFEYGTANCAESTCTSVPPSAIHSTAAGPIEVSQPVTGLQPETTYHSRIVATNSFGTTNGQDETFSTGLAVKGLKTGPAEEVNLTGAALTGELNPDELDTKYHFEYGVDSGYGQETPIVDAGQASGEVPVTPATITGLQPDTPITTTASSPKTALANRWDRTVPSRLRAPRSIGSFSTSKVTASSADLHARINPEEFETTYYFEYGTTPSYGTSVPMPAGVVGSAGTDQSVTVHLENLQPITYHFQVVATNKWGTTKSGDQTFEFYPPSCPNGHVASRPAPVSFRTAAPTSLSPPAMPVGQSSSAVMATPTTRLTQMTPSPTARASV